MRHQLGRMIDFIFNKMGYAVLPRSEEDYLYFPDLDSEFRDIYEQCKDYTMTGVAKMYALYKAVAYVVRHEIAGDLVECGVWKGGSAMLMTLVLKKEGDTTRKLYLYDTYTGMSEPTEKDQSCDGKRNVLEEWEKQKQKGYNQWCYASLEEVKRNLARTSYPPENIVYVQGKVQDTIPGNIPERLSILRLDTDWYKSTRHELQYLFPKLSTGGVLLIDDYGYWEGARKAVDEYFEENKTPILLNRIDAPGRIAIKV